MKRISTLLILAALASPALADVTPEQSKQDFLQLCTPCHGRGGKGDGTQAAKLAKAPPDLTVITQKYGEFPAQKVFETIAGIDMPDGHGTRDMPIWGSVFINEQLGKSTSVEDAMKASDETTQRIMGLVKYVESIQVQ